MCFHGRLDNALANVAALHDTRRSSGGEAARDWAALVVGVVLATAGVAQRHWVGVAVYGPMAVFWAVRLRQHRSEASTSSPRPPLVALRR